MRCLRGTRATHTKLAVVASYLKLKKQECTMHKNLSSLMRKYYEQQLIKGIVETNSLYFSNRPHEGNVGVQSAIRYCRYATGEIYGRKHLKRG